MNRNGIKNPASEVEVILGLEARPSSRCNSVLFLNELPEFKRNVLEVMRQPLEDGNITVSRAIGSINYPASFMLVAAMNPCPCGFFTDPQKECTCTPLQIQRYRSKVSGPLLDRIDIQVEVPTLRYQELASKDAGEPSAEIRQAGQRRPQHSTQALRQTIYPLQRPNGRARSQTPLAPSTRTQKGFSSTPSISLG